MAQPLDPPENRNAPPPERTPTDEHARASPSRHRGRAWGIVGGVILLILVICILLAPRFLSTPTGTRWLLSVASGYVDGDIHADRLELSWAGPISVLAFRIEDDQNRDVVRMARADTPVGLWRLFRRYEHFTRIVIESPEIVIYESPEPGEFEVEKDFSIGHLKDAHGEIRIEDGTFRFVRLDESSYQIDQINGQVDLKTFNEITSSWTMRTQDGARIVSEANIRDMFPEGRFDPLNASGQVDLQTEEGRIALAPLARLAGHEAELQGTASVTLDGTFEPGQTQTQLVIDVADVQSAERAAADAAPINARMEATVHGTPEEWTGNSTLEGDMGVMQSSFRYVPGEEPVEFSRDRFVRGLLAGESVMWPDFTMEGQSTIDLAKLGQAVPEMLHIREDQELTAGTLEISEFTIRGGQYPSLTGVLSIRDVAAVGGGRETRISPIAANIQAGIEQDEGLHIRQLEMEASFARLSGSGTVESMNVTFQSDLAVLQEEVGQIFELGATDLAGQLDAELEASRREEQYIDILFQANIEWSYTIDGIEVRVPRQRIEHSGTITLEDQQATLWTVERLTVDAGQDLSIEGTGFYNLRDESLRAEMNIPHGQLALLASLAAPLAGPDVGRYAGAFTGRAVFNREAGGQPFTSEGQLRASELRVDEQPLAEGETSIDWSELSFEPGNGGLHLASAQVQNQAGSVDIRNVRWQPGNASTLQGEAEGSADLASSLSALARINRQERDPEIEGRLHFVAQAEARADTVAITGQGRIDQFRIPGTAEDRGEQVEWVYDLTLDTQQNLLTLAQCDLTSSPLSFQLAGRVEEYDTRRVLHLEGHYEATWSELTRLLHEMAPATVENISVSGRSSGPITIHGPANVPDAQPAFREVQAGFEFGWAGANLFGMEVAEATLRPELSEGRLTVPRTTVASRDGQIHIVGGVDFAPEEPLLTIPGENHVVEDVPLSRELGNKFLSRLNPIFMHTSHLSGRLNMTVQDVAIPLDQVIQERGSGSGRLDLSDLRIGPNPMLMELLTLAGVAARREEGYRVRASAVDFELKDGRLHYDHFSLTFPDDFDLRFRGSVGFDDTVDLVVSVPVGAELVRRVGIRGVPLQALEILAGTHADIPIGGTRDNPHLDLGRVDLRKQVAEAVERAAGRAVERALEELLRRERRER